jgi:hypothetical protein
VIVLRTFSKAFALAGARVGYALSSRELAQELYARQAPAPVTSLSAALAVAALASPPDVRPVVEERERLASSLRAIGLEPLPSNANFLFVPVEDGHELSERLLRQGLVVRAYDDGIRITVRTVPTTTRSSRTLARLLDRPAPVAESAARSVRYVRATAETRISVRLGLDGASRVSVQTGAGIYDHFLEQLAFHAGLDLVVEARATSRRATTTPSRTPRSRSARRSTARSATGAGSRATATRSCRWTTRSRGRRSTSAAGRTPS